MPIPAPGRTAPDFELPDQDGKPVRLKQFRGQRVVLYFYPKDDTSGCTREACAFRDDHARYRKQGAVILGVSPDDSESHTRFREKFRLPFPLLADDGHKVGQAYGVWGKKKFMGREYMGIRRTTFIIGPDGKVEDVFEGVRVDGHSREILGKLSEKPSAKAKAKS